MRLALRPKVTLKNTAGLSGEEAGRLRKQLQILVQEVLDLRISFKEQDPSKLEQFRLKAMQTCPILQKYEYGWPAMVYARQYLWKVNYDIRLGKGRRAKTLGIQKTARTQLLEPTENVRQQSEKPVPSLEENLMRRTRTPAKPHALCRIVRSTSRGGREEPDNVLSETEHSVSALAAHIALAPEPPAESVTLRETESPDSLSSFLAAAKLLHLRSRFITAGISTLCSILDLSDWTEEERLSFLRAKMRLTLLQSRVVDNALGSMEICAPLRAGARYAVYDEDGLLA
ncbi:hypothetical protein OBBRIDRAFT_892074 [Obba rivulosa]|uniref:Uncharacterized protein n=1 Tax=Obba rivulosa TaxID=1052685 RepID=A0A8E2DIN5_9APHY|nr:hypothetical protein OBBRIDRAFT_892074 [Obba rivulosa]